MTEPKEYSPDELKFILSHIQDDPVKLTLKYHNQPGKSSLISQISARKKLRKKLPHWLSFDQIQFPEGLALEQASSEATAKLKASLIDGDKLLDLTGGLGIDTYYLSQSFNHTSYVEKQKLLADYARFNFAILGAEIDVFHSQAEDMLKHSDADFIYLDPHRRGEGNQKQIILSDHEPNVLRLLPNLLKPGRKTLIKTSPMLDISMALDLLPDVSEVWVISVSNDCKEVLYLIDVESTSSTCIRTWNISGGRAQYFEAQLSHYSQPPETSQPSNFIYEPNSAIFKGGLQDQVALQLKLNKLHPNSHLYTSQELIPNYPGKSFRVKQILKAWDKTLKGGKYNLINRNFPEKASVIESKMRLKSSNTDYIVATKLENNRSVFIEADLLSSTN